MELHRLAGRFDIFDAFLFDANAGSTPMRDEPADLSSQPLQPIRRGLVGGKRIAWGMSSEEEVLYERGGSEDEDDNNKQSDQSHSPHHAAHHVLHHHANLRGLFSTSLTGR
jgi:hypothetical protein